MWLKIRAGTCILYVEVVWALFCEGVRLQEHRVFLGKQLFLKILFMWKQCLCLHILSIPFLVTMECSSLLRSLSSLNSYVTYRKICNGMENCMVVFVSVSDYLWTFPVSTCSVKRSIVYFSIFQNLAQCQAHNKHSINT